MADAYRRLYVQQKAAKHADEAIALYKRARELFIRDGKVFKIFKFKKKYFEILKTINKENQEPPVAG